MRKIVARYERGPGWERYSAAVRRARRGDPLAERRPCPFRRLVLFHINQLQAKWFHVSFDTNHHISLICKEDYLAKLKCLIDSKFEPY